MKIIDISWTLEPEMTGYKDKKELEIIETKVFDKDNIRETKFTIGSHAGTHVDAPYHMLKDGQTIDKIKLENLIGPCQVLDLTNLNSINSENKISKNDLLRFNIKPESIILLKTINSDLVYNAKFKPDFIYLDYEAAEYLVDLQVKAVGIDYLGLERDQPGHPTHKILLENNISIIEGLRLKEVEQGAYFFICLPLNLLNLDAAPARAILIV